MVHNNIAMTKIKLNFRVYQKLDKILNMRPFIQSRHISPIKTLTFSGTARAFPFSTQHKQETIDGIVLHVCTRGRSISKLKPHPHNGYFISHAHLFCVKKNSFFLEAYL